MKYSNNYYYVGKTCIFYKAVTKDVISDIDRTINEFGVEYKKSTDSTYIKIPLIKNATMRNVKESMIKEEGNFAFKIRKTPNNPFIGLIENLTPNTTYHVRTYFIDSSNNTSTFNPCTAKTLANTSSSVKCTGYVRTTASEVDFNREKPKIEAAMNEALFLMNSITNCINWTFEAKIAHDGNGSAADSSMTFQWMFLGSNIRSVIIHEMAHNYFKDAFISSTENMKFMEFATDCEKAICKRLSHHYYPIISSAQYDYVDDALIVLTMQISQTL